MTAIDPPLIPPVEPRAALIALGDGFFKDDSWLRGCEQVQADQIPAEARRLLVHNHHMTATLNARHGQSVALKVLEHREDDSTYRRKILLTIDHGRVVVEFGLVRLTLEVLPAAARREVVERALPLGEIFARHDVLTQVEPRWYFRFAAPSPLVQYFPPTPKLDVYGRVGMIYCNGLPAVELLEVVSESRS